MDNKKRMPEDEAPEGEVLADPDEERGAEMIYATREGAATEVKNFLADGVPVGYKDASGWTALKWAACEGHEEILALLIEHGAAEDEVESLSLDKSPEDGAPAGSSLHWAAYKGHTRLVWRLLTCKPKLSARGLDGEENTPLHLAAAGGHVLILKTLLSEGCDVALKNAYGNTALQLSTSGECQQLLRDAAAAALDGRPYLCSCSGVFCSEKGSVADVVCDAVSSPNVRPVRYSSASAASVRAAEDALSAAMRAPEVAPLESAIAAATKIGAALPLISEATAALETLRARLALGEALDALQAARPTDDRALLRPTKAPLKAAKENNVAANLIADAEALIATVDAEVALFDVIAQCAPHVMAPDPELEEGAVQEPPSADSDPARRADGMAAKLAGAIAHAQSVEALEEVLDKGEAMYGHLTAESELRKGLLEPKTGTGEDGTPFWTEHDGKKVYTALEDLQFRNDFLDAAIEKCQGAQTVPAIVEYALGRQKDLKALLKQAQIEEEERLAKEAAAAAKAAKKKKGK